MSVDQTAENGTNGTTRTDDRKLFVGGLSSETTEKELRDHFGQYGEIESVNVKTDPNSGRSRGFGFIVFKEAEAIDRVVSAGEHKVNNKTVDAKKAKARQGKIFVGGLTSEISDEDIKTFFGQFGTIANLELPFDKQKNQRKNFCFVTYDSEQVVNDLLKTPKQTINGKEVDVKKATPKPDNAQMGGRGGRGPPRPWFGGPKGYGQGWGGQNAGGFSGYGQGWFGPGDFGYGGNGGGYQGGKQRGPGPRQQRNTPY